MDQVKVFMVLAILCINLSYHGILCFCDSMYYSCDAGRKISSISREDDLEMDRQLNILNKTPVKSIQTAEGDIFDCIDIYKQPAFDNPLLKDLKLQMKPSSGPRTSHGGKTSLSSSTTKDKQSLNALRSFDCPKGTVPIRRTSKEDLIRAKSFAELHCINRGIRPLFADQPGQHVTQGFINIANPTVGMDQHSSGQIWIETGPTSNPQSIQAGWAVSPSLYGDNRTHAFVSWHANGTGCFNLLCSGFVQVHEGLTVGSVIDTVSQYGGDQYTLDLIIHQDKETGDWWLQGGSELHNIGYWPGNIFPDMGKDQGASFVAWGGLTRTSSNNSPRMGNGYFPKEDYTKACSVVNVQVTDENYTLRDVTSDEIEVHTDSIDCYLVKFGGFLSQEDRIGFMFGGPGGDKCPSQVVARKLQIIFSHLTPSSYNNRPVLRIAKEVPPPLTIVKLWRNREENLRDYCTKYVVGVGAQAKEVASKRILERHVEPNVPRIFLPVQNYGCSSKKFVTEESPKESLALRSTSCNCIRIFWELQTT
ncbi:hypothetical protein MKW98_032689 [Papaver atlanticum]|uniref:Neprosin PEP catalytic domain-containing protein n=1 Tax=Papaver atlanticum TaxID=357466 RepID=A0AAD4SUS4_9MAGN|nr:hypothetical protein MKW98_032689 [Papaver atlanticum]